MWAQFLGDEPVTTCAQATQRGLVLAADSKGVFGARRDQVGARSLSTACAWLHAAVSGSRT